MSGLQRGANRALSACILLVLLKVAATGSHTPSRIVMERRTRLCSVGTQAGSGDIWIEMANIVRYQLGDDGEKVATTPYLPGTCLHSGSGKWKEREQER